MATDKRTEPYKVYEYLRVNMYERVNGVRVKRENSVERLEEMIEEVMDKLYIMHRKEVENGFKGTRELNRLAKIPIK